jgi:acetoin utilization deacetylase AcuC-like enzyme
LALGPVDFTTISQKLKEAFGSDKIMFGLEGGYDPEGVAEAVKATVAPFLPSSDDGRGGGVGGGAGAAAAM